MAGEHLDLSSDDSGRPRPSGENLDATRRPFLGIRFDCCDVYVRVYVNREGTAYEGRCPRCLRSVRLLIGPGGTSQRFFTAR